MGWRYRENSAKESEGEIFRTQKHWRYFKNRAKEIGGRSRRLGSFVTEMKFEASVSLKSRCLIRFVCGVSPPVRIAWARREPRRGCSYRGVLSPFKRLLQFSLRRIVARASVSQIINLPVPKELGKLCSSIANNFARCI